MNSEFQNWIGREVIYISKSGNRYPAKVTAIPERPQHGYTDRPTVSLEYRNQIGKLIRVERVIPDGKDFTNRIWIENNNQGTK